MPQGLYRVLQAFRTRLIAHRIALIAVLLPPVLTFGPVLIVGLDQRIGIANTPFGPLSIAALMPAIIVTTLYYAGLLGWQLRATRRALRLRETADHDAQEQARHDSLTGLLNRRSLIEEGEADAACAPTLAASVLVMDLDGFQPINHSFGAEAGDVALRNVADRLTALYEGIGHVARTGGDEFSCVLLHDGDPATPVAMAEEMIAAVAKPIRVRGGLAEVGASVGIVTGAAGDVQIEHLLRLAEFAMVRAKRDEQSSYCVFEAGMDQEMRDRSQLEVDMRAGIARGEFVPHYQPIVDLETGDVVGFECLARWNHPSRGLIAPDNFIDIAEEAGMIQDLGFAILRQACADARQWPQTLTLSVNISPLQLSETRLPERILQILCATGISPGRLIVEVTESRLVRDIDTARAILLSLKQTGIQIALDDFGTGYASLKHLRELSFTRIKIDRSFVQDMAADENGQIVRAILNLSQGLGLPVTAEGIETPGAASALASLGCTYGQGYLYSRPLDAAGALRIARGSACRGDVTAALHAPPPPPRPHLRSLSLVKSSDRAA